MPIPIAQKLLETTTITLLGDLPNLFLGAKLRNWVYPLIFGSFRRPVYIHKSVEIINGRAIDLDTGVFIFNGVRINASGDNNRVSIGKNTSLMRDVDICALDNTKLVIGQECFIGPFTCIVGPGDIEIGDNCSIAAHCGIFANNHKFDDPALGPNDQGLTRQGIVIEKECWVGHSVSILDGVRIGSGSVIGAGAVVTHDIPPNSIAVGVPAKVIKTRVDLNAGTLRQE